MQQRGRPGDAVRSRPPPSPSTLPAVPPITDRPRRAPLRWGLRALYALVVLVLSVGVLVAFVLFLESEDPSSVGTPASPPPHGATR